MKRTQLIIGSLFLWVSGAAFAAPKLPPKPAPELIPHTDVLGGPIDHKTLVECARLLEQTPSNDSISILSDHFRQSQILSPTQVQYNDGHLYSVIAQSPEGPFKIRGEHNGRIAISGPANSELSFGAHDGDAVSSIQFGNVGSGVDDARFLTVGADSQVQLYGLSYDGQEIKAPKLATVDLKFDQPIVSAVDSDLGVFALGTVNGNVEIRSLDSGILLREIKNALNGESVSGLAFDLKNRELLMVGYRGAYAHAALEGDEPVSVQTKFFSPKAAVNKFEMSLHELNSVVGRTDGVVELHDAATHELIAEAQITEKQTPITATYLSADGDLLLVGDMEGRVYVVDAMANPALAVLHRLPCPEEVAKAGYAGREVARIDMDESNAPEWIEVHYRSGHSARFPVVSKEEMETN